MTIPKPKAQYKRPGQRVCSYPRKNQARAGATFEESGEDGIVLVNCKLRERLVERLGEEAEKRGTTTGTLIAKLISAVVKDNLYKAVLED